MGLSVSNIIHNYTDVFLKIHLYYHSWDQQKMLLTFFVLLLLFLLTVCIGFLGISYILTPSSSDLPYATTYSSTLILLQQQLFSYYISTIIFCTFFATCCLFVISSKNRNMIIINMIRLEYINLSFFIYSHQNNLRNRISSKQRDYFDENK